MPLSPDLPPSLAVSPPLVTIFVLLLLIVSLKSAQMCGEARWTAAFKVYKLWNMFSKSEYICLCDISGTAHAGGVAHAPWACTAVMHAISVCPAGMDTWRMWLCIYDEFWCKMKACTPANISSLSAHIDRFLTSKQQRGNTGGIINSSLHAA